MTTPMRCALAAAVGLLAAGPLVRAAVWRHAADDPLRAACPACARSGWIAPSGPFTGRCPRCRVRTGPARMLPEALTAAGFAVVAALHGPPVQALALGWFAATGIASALVDAAVHRLPDRLTAPAFAGTALLLTIAALASRQPAAVTRLWLAAATLGAGYLALALIAGIGLGDVKFAPTAGAALGYFSWSALARGTLAAFLLGALFAAARMAIGGVNRNRALPLGPFMLLGVFAALAATAP
jgi:leader peptidase (prepilin peptidase)/N-methyltransferase